MSSKIIRPGSVKEVCSLLMRHREEASILAGGTDVLVQIRDGAIRPAFLIDISDMEELRTVTSDEHEICIGAGLSLSELVESEQIEKEVPSLWTAAIEVGAVQIRNRATIGGNLANGSPAADLTPPLVSLDAEVSLQGGEGMRRIAVADLATGPGQTDIGPDEVITCVHIPRLCRRQGDVFLKVGKRKALAISVANVAVSVCLSEDLKSFESVRLALGSVAPTVVRAFTCEERFRGKSVDVKSIDEALQGIEEEISPIDDLRATAKYRRMVSRRITRQALLQAVDQVCTKM